MEITLDGKVALVSGASKGIGKAIAATLAASGAKVMLNSRKQDQLEAAAAEMTGEVDIFACNAGDDDAGERAVTATVERFGGLDILVNNAATNPHFGHITETDVGAFQKTVDVNIRGYFFMSSAGAKLMAKNGGGSIVNVASVNGVTPGAQQGIYSITKAAVISMTKAFARECAPQKVRVNALLPGATDTKFASALFHNPVILEQALTRIPMHRVAEPSEMAGAVLYLASDAASYTTGAALNVDGGYLCS
jgi:NAD(P)-dependent dehydrogenase (short-subunit alcohol dehydrogenase family)